MGQLKSIGIPNGKKLFTGQGSLQGLYEDVLVLNSMSAGIKTKAEIPIWEMEERILASDLTHRLRLCLFPNLVMLMQCLQVKTRLDLDAYRTFGLSIISKKYYLN